MTQATSQMSKYPEDTLSQDQTTPVSPIDNNDVKNTSDDDVKTPDTLKDKYTFLKLLGKGNQGKVYEGIRNSDGQHVAIKVLNINSIQNWKEYDLFWREVETLKLLHIEGVAKFYEAVEDLNPDRPRAYLVQQCIGGRTLSDMISLGYRFSIQDVFRFAIQLIDILDQLHHHDPPIIHRDIKPSNIILEPDGKFYKVYLTDFGAVSNPLLQKGGSTVAGTYGYMPPEQLMGRPDPASDTYALGATIAGLLSGMEPADMPLADYRLAIEKPLENLPYPIVSCLRCMTLPNQEDRLADHARLRQIFQSFSEGNFSTNLLPSDESASQLSSSGLKSVRNLGQKGNFDLWLNLPEETPRPIPREYQKLKPISNRTISLMKAFPLCEIAKLHPVFLINDPSQYISSVFLFLAVLLLWIITVPFFTIFQIIEVINNYASRHSDRKQALPKILNLITNGRKALATVVSINYIDSDINEHDSPVYALNDSSENKIGLDTYVIEENSLRPRFLISYTFNPPDDSLTEDLVHSIKVTFDPGTCLHVGEMLPILYAIDPKNNRSVTSMPFPIPLKRNERLQDILCTTLHGERIITPQNNAK